MSAALPREDKVRTYRKWVGVTAREKAGDWSYWLVHNNTNTVDSQIMNVRHIITIATNVYHTN